MTSSSDRRSASRRDRHGWNALPKYLKAHHGHLDRLRGYLIEEDDLQYDFLPPNLYVISGRVRCRHGLFVDVNKTLEINARNWVRTIKYGYHAGVEGRRDRGIFRYDNAHQHPVEGHHDAHHKHRFDPTDWTEILPPEWIGHDRWPHLDKVIEELAHWWETTGQFLDLTEVPDANGTR